MKMIVLSQEPLELVFLKLQTRRNIS